MDVLRKPATEESVSSRGLGAFLRRYRVAIIVIAVLLALIWLVLHNAHSRQQAGQMQGAPRGTRGMPMGVGPVSVAIGKVNSGDIQVRVPALGTVTPLATVTVRTQISGQLQKIAFTEGQLVHQGDFLAQIDPRPYEAALKAAQGAERRDRALLADAKLDLKRYQDLIKDDAVSQQQLDAQKWLVDQYEGTVEADVAQVNSASVNLQYTHIVSPVTGRVGLRQVDQGNYVTPGDANGIVVITQLQPITVLFPIPEDNVTDIMKRLYDGASLAAVAYDRSNKTQLAEGKLLTVDNEIDTTTGTVKLRALFDNKEGLLFPNQFVNIELIENTLHGQIVMPNAAVHRGAPNGVVTTFVYVVNYKDSTVSVRPVKLGDLDGERVAVLSGLSVGETVVTEGGDRLRDGADVLLPGAKPPQMQVGQANGKRRWGQGANPSNGGGGGRPGGGNGTGGKSPQ